MLERIVLRHESALAEAYDRHIRPVGWFAHSILPAHLVDDAIQSTFLTLWNKAERIHLVGNSLLPWLIGVCRQHSRSLLRKEARHVHEEIEDTMPAGADVEAAALRRHLLAAIEEHVAHLGDLDAQIYRLCIHEEMSYEDAAGRLGVSTSTIRNRLSRLRAGLRRRFGGD
ncbi:sigma-70 family RNA polymerase sigma factor [Sinomonas sp. ASV322]|uniref:RNA polymerase sigma factor n=1 Tax=Sinomonas sp. ASV322 TaxID=3041920 RepID=UPI0027DC7C38|nr:sigma-70 family RNA polymerase sigma factor [Sinomonas sp. ASV322]MDQ4503164.1 sigma-70 family RNA polymerase sigma factor [Sinomonas sp. ASV322]